MLQNKWNGSATEQAKLSYLMNTKENIFRQRIFSGHERTALYIDEQRVVEKAHQMV